MINCSYNVNFKGLFNSNSDKRSVAQTEKYEDKFSLSGKTASLPICVTKYSAQISDMQSYIAETKNVVQRKREQADKYLKNVNSIAGTIRRGIVPKNVIYINQQLGKDKYETIIQKSNNGLINQIAHIKNCELKVIYDLLSEVEPSSIDNSNLCNKVPANCYFYSNGNCIEYMQGIKNPLSQYASNSEHNLPYGQWPTRSIDNSPIEKLIAFRDNGSFKSFDNYSFNAHGGYKNYISYDIDRNGKVSAQIDKDNGFSYQYTDSPRGAAFNEHMLTLDRHESPKFFMW